MPVWYTGVLDEHNAVRRAAGLFDVAHMGVFEVSGPHATEFLDIVCSNYARWYAPGESFYSYLLDQDGRVIDDMLVYHRSRDVYQIVVNASNADKDWAWLNAVNNGEVLIDRERPDITGAATGDAAQSEGSGQRPGHPRRPGAAGTGLAGNPAEPGRRRHGCGTGWAACARPA